MTLQFPDQRKIDLIKLIKIVHYNISDLIDILYTYRKPHVSHVTDLWYLHVQVNDGDFLLLYHQEEGHVQGVSSVTVNRFLRLLVKLDQGFDRFVHTAGQGQDVPVDEILEK